MKAIVRDGAAGGRLAFAEVPSPAPARAEVLVRMLAASVNYGSVTYLDDVPDGSVRGSDGVGVVVQAAADGTGPAVGARVAFATPHGSWAEYCRVPAGYAAVVPAGVDTATAAALPAAALTALQAVRRFGSVAGRRILVTGAAGGVGVFAVQLLALAGAAPIAWVGSPARAVGLTELGAHQVVTAAEQVIEPVAGVIDMVGGPVLAAAAGLLADDGLALNVGHASGQATTIDFEELRRLGPGRAIEAFVCTDVSAEALTELLGLVAAGRLTVPLDRVVPWSDFADVVAALHARAVRGKAVIRIQPDPV